jgi:hypothetical protein
MTPLDGLPMTKRSLRGRGEGQETTGGRAALARRAGLGEGVTSLPPHPSRGFGGRGDGEKTTGGGIPSTARVSPSEAKEGDGAVGSPTLFTRKAPGSPEWETMAGRRWLAAARSSGVSDFKEEKGR